MALRSDALLIITSVCLRLASWRFHLERCASFGLPVVNRAPVQPAPPTKSILICRAPPVKWSIPFPASETYPPALEYHGRPRQDHGRLGGGESRLSRICGYAKCGGSLRPHTPKRTERVLVSPVWIDRTKLMHVDPYVFRKGKRVGSNGSQAFTLTQLPYAEVTVTGGIVEEHSSSKRESATPRWPWSFESSNSL